MVALALVNKLCVQVALLDMRVRRLHQIIWHLVPAATSQLVGNYLVCLVPVDFIATTVNRFLYFAHQEHLAMVLKLFGKLIWFWIFVLSIYLIVFTYATVLLLPLATMYRMREWLRQLFVGWAITVQVVYRHVPFVYQAIDVCPVPFLTLLWIQYVQ